MRLALMPADVSALFTALARWSPRARLYSVEPRSSQCPSIVKLMFGMLVQELRVGLHRTLLIAANISLVVVEVDILDVLAEQVFVREPIGGWLSRRRRRLVSP